jgi:hypothetical protein
VFVLVAIKNSHMFVPANMLAKDFASPPSGSAADCRRKKKSEHVCGRELGKIDILWWKHVNAVRCATGI